MSRHATPTCTRRIQFCAGHRVMGHESKCAHLHGHNYVVFVTAQAELDAIGRVIDFSVLKERMGGWLEKEWDHGFILHVDDYPGLDAIMAFQNTMRHKQHSWTQKVYLMPSNPTAENMALYLLHDIGPLVMKGTGVAIVKVVVHETENCFAEACL